MLKIEFSLFGSQEIGSRSDCRAWKIIRDDTKLELISWESNRENPIFNICVGENPKIPGIQPNKKNFVLSTTWNRWFDKSILGRRKANHS